MAKKTLVTGPTFEEMLHPDKIDPKTREAAIKMREEDPLDPINLFNITWKDDNNEIFYHVVPKELTGVEAPIVVLHSVHFPTRSHKVGATYSVLIEKELFGEVDPAEHTLVWPSTGNYCRGGAYDANLMACESIAILPEGMSAERFAWLETIAGEVIKTPGSESNVKEIFDKCAELRSSGEDLAIFNQFDEFGNYLWHYTVTGPAMLEVFDRVAEPGQRLAGAAYSTGSAGTIASADYLKQHHPGVRVAASEALQCPTLLWNGYGAHRIEGIGDKHVPWIHNLRSTDLVTGIDDNGPMALIRLFNDPVGGEYLTSIGVPEDLIARLPELGISSLANLLSAIKLARWYELGPDDVVLTIATDSMDMYQSRLAEETGTHGVLTETDAAVAHHRWLLGETTANTQELGHWDRKRIHNLKYFTWVEQQGKDVAELDRQWHDPGYWTAVQELVEPIDQLIEEFNMSVAS